MMTATTSTIDVELVLVQGGLLALEDIESRSLRHLNSFYIGKYPVKVSEYFTFCEATKRKRPISPPWGWDDETPIVNLSFQDAQAYCEWLGLQSRLHIRLPFEWEWEFAARGGLMDKKHLYAGGNDLDKVGWYKNNSRGMTQRVGEKSPNELDIFDMSGNVWEWCNKEARYETPLETNRQEHSVQVIRGGSWRNGHLPCSLNHRSFRGEDFKNNFLGFRIVVAPSD